MKKPFYETLHTHLPNAVNAACSADRCCDISDKALTRANLVMALNLTADLIAWIDKQCPDATPKQ